MTSYQYAPLPAPTHDEQDIHIRLMKLSPGEDSGDITCTIVSCPLSTPIQYEAVSYCWGNPKDKTQITCAGKFITIPTNLHAFLLRTRAKGAERTLWVDSVCIDQNNQEEKTSQVAAMRHIYRKARRTLIWLGKEEGHTSLGLEFARTLTKRSIESANPDQTKTVEKKVPWYRPKIYDNMYSVFAPEWGALFKIFEREWFLRAWVVQEIAVSTDPWIILGSQAIHWSELITALHYIMTAEQWIFEFYGSGHINIINMMQLSQGEIAANLKVKHYEVLVRHRQSLSTDMRDHIFAFYGLSCHDSFKADNIKTDYNTSPGMVYTDIAVTSLRNASNLDFLDIPRLSRKTNGLDIPSWIPNWSLSENNACSFCLLKLEYQVIVAENEKPKYKATGESKYTPVEEAFPHLQLSGYTVDRIAALSSPWEVQDVSGYQTIRKHAEVLKKNQGFVHEWETTFKVFSRTPYPTGESRRDVMFQSCVVGIFPQGKEHTSKIYSLFEKRQSYLRPIRILNLHSFTWVWMIIVLFGHTLRLLGIPNPEIAFRMLVWSMCNRRAMMTVGGYCGQAPAIAEVGDYVVLAKGGKLPLILRPKDGVKGKEWEFIGDAYVHGMMNGEAWDDKAKFETIVLV